MDLGSHEVHKDTCHLAEAVRQDGVEPGLSVIFLRDPSCGLVLAASNLCSMTIYFLVLDHFRKSAVYVAALQDVVCHIAVKELQAPLSAD